MVAALLLLPPGISLASTVYRCDGPEGARFSDSPCGPEARTIELAPVPGFPAPAAPSREASGNPTPEPPARPAAAPRQSPCRTFLSTDLRTLLVRDQVVPGMTREHVLRAWGKPAERWQEPVEMWSYEADYYGRLVRVTRVYFEDGCVREVQTGPP